VQYHAAIPDMLTVKSNSTKDLLLMFLDWVDVKFKKGESSETIKGQWWPAGE
jgi:hypothetical protein